MRSRERGSGRIEILPLSPGYVESARKLVEEYVRSLGVDLGFQGIEDELRDFPGKYAEPEGAFLLARHGDRLAGCVGLRRIDEDVCEMKRLYVAPAWRGRGLGRALAEAIVAVAREKGYNRMRLDTLRGMAAARATYGALGFHEIGPYIHNPLEGALFFEKELRERGRLA